MAVFRLGVPMSPRRKPQIGQRHTGPSSRSRPSPGREESGSSTCHRCRVAPPLVSDRYLTRTTTAQTGPAGGWFGAFRIHGFGVEP
jgi:hypothetical protein